MAKHRKAKVQSSTPSAVHVAQSSTILSSSIHSGATSTSTSRAPSPPVEDDGEADTAVVKRQPFRFFDLPSELRLRIYEESLHITARQVYELYHGKQEAAALAKDLDERSAPPLDLEPNINWHLNRPRLQTFLVNHRMYDEAYRVFYSQPVRLYPIHGRFFNTKKPLLARLAPKYRSIIHTLDMRLGQGWSKPPRAQNTAESLGLADCINVRTLRIFVEVDPSEPHFEGFRGKGSTKDTYKWFCVDLLVGIMEQVPSLRMVEIEVVEGMKGDAPLVNALCLTAKNAGKVLVKGDTLRAAEHKVEENAQVELRQLAAAMRLDNVPRLIEIEA